MRSAARRTAALLHTVLQFRAQRAWAPAAEALARAGEAAAGDAESCGLVGDLCARLEDYGGALRAYDAAIALHPDRSIYWFNRAAVRRYLGQITQAEQDYDQCIALAPQDAQAWLNRAELRTQTPARNHVAALEALLAAGTRPWQDEVALRYALAKELEDLGEWERCWQQLVAGAALRRRHLDYDVRADLETVPALMAAFPGAATRPAGNPCPEPIFILGMPRTGSTLVDRIVGSHSTVTSAGELLHLGQAVAEAARRAAGPSATRGALIGASAHIDFAALGADYLERTRPATGHTPHFTDKLPLNYLYCAHVAAALPNARIVHVMRHPLATCYGVFKILFDQGYPFSYDLAEIADYYIAYRRLMDHWHATLPGRIIDVQYEDLVRDAQGCCTVLFERIGLPWEPQCLQFHDNPAPTATASATQVRRPIYTGALAQWRHFERGLAPVRARLAAAGIACD